MATITTLLDGITGLSFRTTVNNNFANLNADKTETTVTSALDTRVTTLETNTAALTPCIVVVQRAATSADQTLSAGVNTILNCIETEVLNEGSCFTTNTALNKITVNDTGFYRVSGVMNIAAEINKMVTITLYVDNLPTPFSSTLIGRGLDKPVSIPYSAIGSFNINDEIELHAECDEDTDITINSFNMSIESTPYTGA